MPFVNLLLFSKYSWKVDLDATEATPRSDKCIIQKSHPDLIVIYQHFLPIPNHFRVNHDFQPAIDTRYVTWGVRWRYKPEMMLSADFLTSFLTVSNAHFLSCTCHSKVESLSLDGWLWRHCWSGKLGHAFDWDKRHGFLLEFNTHFLFSTHHMKIIRIFSIIHYGETSILAARWRLTPEITLSIDAATMVFNLCSTDIYSLSPVISML